MLNFASEDIIESVHFHRIAMQSSFSSKIANLGCNMAICSISFLSWESERQAAECLAADYGSIKFYNIKQTKQRWLSSCALRRWNLQGFDIWTINWDERFRSMSMKDQISAASANRFHLHSHFGWESLDWFWVPATANWDEQHCPWLLDGCVFLCRRVGRGGRGLFGLLCDITVYLVCDRLTCVTNWCLMMPDARIGSNWHDVTHAQDTTAQFTCVCACEWYYDMLLAWWGLTMHLHTCLMLGYSKIVCTCNLVWYNAAWSSSASARLRTAICTVLYSGKMW